MHKENHWKAKNEGVLGRRSDLLTPHPQVPPTLHYHQHLAGCNAHPCPCSQSQSWCYEDRAVALRSEKAVSFQPSSALPRSACDSEPFGTISAKH